MENRLEKLRTLRERVKGFRRELTDNTEPTYRNSSKDPTYKSPTFWGGNPITGFGYVSPSKPTKMLSPLIQQLRDNVDVSYYASNKLYQTTSKEELHKEWASIKSPTEKLNKNNHHRLTEDNYETLSPNFKRKINKNQTIRVDSKENKNEYFECRENSKETIKHKKMQNERKNSVDKEIHHLNYAKNENSGEKTLNKSPLRSRSPNFRYYEPSHQRTTIQRNPIINPEIPKQTGKKIVKPLERSPSAMLIENPNSDIKMYTLKGKSFFMEKGKCRADRNSSPGVDRLFNSMEKAREALTPKHSNRKHFARYYEETLDSNFFF